MLFLQHLKWLFFRSSLQSAILLSGLLHLLLAVTLKDERGSSFRYEQALNNCGCCYRQLWPWARAISVIPKISQVVISWDWKGKATFVDWGQFPTLLTWEVMLLFSCPAFAFHVYIICTCIFINIHYTHTHSLHRQQPYEAGRIILISHMGRVRHRDAEYLACAFIQLKNGGPGSWTQGSPMPKSLVNPHIFSFLWRGGRWLLT